MNILDEIAEKTRRRSKWKRFFVAEEVMLMRKKVKGQEHHRFYKSLKEGMSFICKLEGISVKGVC